MKEEQVGFFLGIECDLENILNDRVEGVNVLEVDVPGVEDLGLGVVRAGKQKGELILSCSSRDILWSRASPFPPPLFHTFLVTKGSFRQNEICVKLHFCGGGWAGPALEQSSKLWKNLKVSDS